MSPRGYPVAYDLCQTLSKAIFNNLLSTFCRYHDVGEFLRVPQNSLTVKSCDRPPPNMSSAARISAPSPLPSARSWPDISMTSSGLPVTIWPPHFRGRIFNIEDTLAEELNRFFPGLLGRGSPNGDERRDATDVVLARRRLHKGQDKIEHDRRGVGILTFKRFTMLRFSF